MVYQWYAVAFYILILLSQTSYAVTLSGKVTVLDKNGNALDDASNVVVFVDGIEAPSRTDEPLKVYQKDQVFKPSVLAVVKGQTVDFENNDVLFHNVFSLSRAKKFDLGVYKKGKTKSVTFDTPGVVNVYCNIHPNMAGNVIVLNNPYFIVTDASGIFKIENAPKPPFKIRTWYRFSESLLLDIPNEDSLTNDLHIKITKKIRQHKNKFGKRYKEKY